MQYRLSQKHHLQPKLIPEEPIIGNEYLRIYWIKALSHYRPSETGFDYCSQHLVGLTVSSKSTQYVASYFV
jgi:hypothetical protein